MEIDNHHFFNLPDVQTALSTSKSSQDFVKIDQFFYRIITYDPIPRSPELIMALQEIGTGQKQLYFEVTIGRNILAQFDQKTHRITLYANQ